jgi:hypothetical protein
MQVVILLAIAVVGYEAIREENVLGFVMCSLAFVAFGTLCLKAGGYV